MYMLPQVEVIVSSDEEEEEEPETAERMQHKEPQVEQQPRPKVHDDVHVCVCNTVALRC